MSGFGLAAAGSGIGATAQFGSDMFGYYGAKKQNDWNTSQAERERDWNAMMWHKGREFDQSMWQKTNDFNLEMWNRMNKYNSPKAQMQRFKEAGLNPNLIYGMGTHGNAGQQTRSGGAPGAGQANKYSRAQMQNVFGGMRGPMAAFNKFAEVAAQKDNVQATVELKNQDAVKRALESEGIAAENVFKKRKAGFAKEFIDHDLTIARENANQAIEKTWQAQTKTDLDRFTYGNKIEQSNQELKQAQNATTKGEIENSILQVKSTLAQMGLENADSITKYMALHPEKVEQVLDKLSFTGVSPETLAVLGTLVTTAFSKGKTGRNALKTKTPKTVKQAGPDAKKLSRIKRKNKFSAKVHKKGNSGSRGKKHNQMKPNTDFLNK